MKKVLFISYAFPPMGGGGIFRITKFIKYLPEFGIQPRVLTVKNHFHPYKDETLLAQIPEAIEVTRIDYNDPALWIKAHWWQSFLFYGYYPWFSISDQRISWIRPAIEEAVKIIKKEGIDTIFTSFAPASDHLIGLEVKKRTGVKWVADFRDEWATSNYYSFPTPLHAAKVRNLEKDVIMAADVITTVSEPLTAYFAKTCGEPDKCLTLTNGFDREDFEEVINLPKRDYCQILYAGAFYGKRSADTFNQAVEELNLPDLKVEFFSGKERISHNEAIVKQQEADILLLVLSPQDRPAVFTGKIFEYLAARRPILALAPKKTAAAKLITDLGVGEVVDPLDKEGIKTQIKKMYEAWQKGTLSIPQVDLSPYDRRNLTERLADIFKTLSEIKLRVLILANNHSPQNEKLINYLVGKQYDVHFVSLDETGVKGVPNYHIQQKKLVAKNGCFGPLFLFQSFMNKFYALGEVKKLIEKIKPDIVHGHGVNFGGILAVYSGFHPTIITTRGSDVMKVETQPKFLQYLIKKSLQKADLVTGSSVALREKSLKLGVKPKNWREVYFGINMDIFKKKDVSNLKDELGLTDEKVIFSARSLKQIYNIDILVQAVAQLEEKNWKMILMGQNQDEFYLKKIKKMIIELGFEEKIIFLPKVDVEKMAELYNLADVVVSIAQSDGAAVSFMEAMACEAKIVISDVGFVKEWQEGTKFWVVPIGDIEETRKSIKEALELPKSDFKSWGEKNRAIINERAEINSSFKKFEDIYKELT
jgi:glycosyltransferase involved in cell wall biosynthesis